MPFRFKNAFWLAWAVIAVILTAGIVRWHVEYFRSPGPQFYSAAVVGLPLLAIGALAWARLRTGFLWRYELIAIVLVPAAVTLLREPRATLVIVALFAACYCAGRALGDCCGWSTNAPVADLVFSTASGLALLNTALLMSGLARVWYPWFFALLLLAPLVIFRRNLLRLIDVSRTIFLRWADLKDLQRPIAGILIPFAAILAACTTVLMLAPTLSWDAMKMHFPLAQYYLQVHALEPKPDLLYSFFPQATESMFALAWALGGQAAAQFIAPMFFVLSLLALWILARDCAAAADEALAGVVLAASLPVLHWAASVPKTDAELTFFLLASLAAAVRWQASLDFKWAQAGVLFLAGGFAQKDLALLGAISLGSVFLYAAWRQPRRLRAFASLAMFFALVALIWNARRFALSGNPIYPLMAGQGVYMGSPPIPHFSEAILRVVRLPWDLHVHGHDFSETVLIAPLGIVFVVLWPVWLFTKRPNRAEYLCLWFAIPTFLLWGYVSPLVRYALAPLAVFALLTGVRLGRFWRTSPRTTQASLAAACLWILIPAICACMIIEINAPQLRYVAGRIGRDDYLSQALITYRSLAWLRDHTAPSERILGLDNCSDAYAPPFPSYRSGCGTLPRSAGEVAAELRVSSDKPPFDWLLAPPREHESDLAAARAIGRVAVEKYRDEDFVIYRLQ